MACKYVVVGTAVIVVAWASFIYAAINTVCDDDYWPE